MGYPTLIQEQNSYAGLTNKMLAKDARTICVAYEGMERFFPAEKIVFTGNPIRADIEKMTATKEEGRAHFELADDSKVLLIIGGSLGARSINQMMLSNLELVKKIGQEQNLQVIWQTGQWMNDEAVAAVKQAGADGTIKVHRFI
jgi:UDP-N-acetylglucosamine--N-acetylmuramyl-(pentapeptide) pyrophosphoryl-undecaprenol N-acetylglucosamine transferase